MTPTKDYEQLSEQIKQAACAVCRIGMDCHDSTVRVPKYVKSRWAAWLVFRWCFGASLGCIAYEYYTVRQNVDLGIGRAINLVRTDQRFLEMVIEIGKKMSVENETREAVQLILSGEIKKASDVTKRYGIIKAA